MGRAYEARRRVVLPTHSPEFLALGEGHLQPSVAAGNGAFDWNFSRHFRYRHITLAMLAHAYLTVIRHQAMEQGEKGATTAPMKS